MFCSQKLQLVVEEDQGADLVLGEDQEMEEDLELEEEVVLVEEAPWWVEST